MWRIISLFMISMLFTLPVSAQEAPSSILLEEEKSQSSSEEIDKMLGLSEEEKALRNVYQYANEHYKRCIKVPHHVLHGESLEMMCSCVSANMSKIMTLEQITEISKGTEEGQLQLGRMLMFVYHPCIKKPLFNVINDQCLYNIKNQHLMKKQRATCQCIAERVSTGMDDVAGIHIRSIIMDKPKQFDPIDLLIPAKDYERRFAHNSRVCIKKHERGYH